MAKLDIETLLGEIEATLKANLNTEITAINTEKGDSLLSTFDNTKDYFFQTWNDRIFQSKKAIFFGLQEVATTGVGPATGMVLKIFIDVVVLDNGNEPQYNTVKRILRYTRALQEVIEKNWDKFSRGAKKLKVDVSIPAAIKPDLDSANEYKVGGIMISTSIF